MPFRLRQFTVPVSAQDHEIFSLFCNTYNLAQEDISFFEIQKKSLDARKKSKIVYHYQLCFDLKREIIRPEFEEVLLPSKASSILGDTLKRKEPFSFKPVIIGSGPSGLFTALVLAKRGHPVILVERGEPVETRLRTVNRLKRGIFNPESHFCYGEGGAGTFSDGKLTCGRNHPLIRYVFEELVAFGAPSSILYDAHPHMGTDYLFRVVMNIRKYLESMGSIYRFSETFTGFQYEGSPALGSPKFQVNLASGDTIPTDHLILAIGHSARDTYRQLFSQGLAIEQKPFAMGARIEHPQEQINRIQFGDCPYLPSAEYKLAAQVQDRGIWTFCMCPGGFLLPTSAQEGHLAINGMSYHKRQSGFANAAIVVNVRREDYDKGHPLDGLVFQEELEKKAFTLGGGGYISPAQRVLDFLKDRPSKGELKSTYKPGIQGAMMKHILPDFVSNSLKEALKEYHQKMPGYLSPEALIVGLESKTSAPICMPRGRDFQSLSHPGLYPAGEGAGYAGGIVSAALDGVRVAQALLA